MNEWEELEGEDGIAANRSGHLQAIKLPNLVRPELHRGTARTGPETLRRFVKMRWNRTFRLNRVESLTQPSYAIGLQTGTQV